jgi:hypothetical protein
VPGSRQLLAGSGTSLGKQPVLLRLHGFSRRPDARREQDLAGIVGTRLTTLAAHHGDVQVVEPFLDGTSERAEAPLLSRVVRYRLANDGQRAAYLGVELRHVAEL